MPRRWLFALCLAVLASGCRAPKCHGTLERDDVQRLQKLEADGKYPCSEHLHPRITATRTGVKLGDRLLVSDLPPEGRVERLNPLFQELADDRLTWRQVHPRESFSPKAMARIDPDLPASVGASTLYSMAAAGYSDIHLTTGSIELDFGYAMLPPLGPEDKARDEMHVEWLGSGKYAVALRRKQTVINRPDGPLELDAVPGWIARMCQANCGQALVLHPKGSFLSLVTMMQRVLEVLGNRKQPVRFAGDGHD